MYIGFNVITNSKIFLNLSFAYIRCLAFLIFIITENIVIEHNILFIDSKSTVTKEKK